MITIFFISHFFIGSYGVTKIGSGMF